MRPPVFDFRADTYIEACWFIAGDAQDWMCLLYRHGEGPWEMRYRFRYYTADDPDPFYEGPDADRKSVWHATAKDGSEPTRLDLREKCEQIARESAKKFKLKLWRVICQGDVPRFFQLLSKQPWAHLRTVADPRAPTRPQ